MTKGKHTEANCINKTCVILKDKEDCVAQMLELEKENKELKTFISAYRNERDKIFDAWHTQLAEAKEIIKDMLNNFAYPIGCEDWTEEDIEIVDKAEDFIKE